MPGCQRCLLLNAPAQGSTTIFCDTRTAFCRTMLFLRSTCPYSSMAECQWHFQHQRRVFVSPDSTIPISHIQNDVIRIRNKVRRGTRPVERRSPISRVIRHLGVSYASLLAVVGLKRTWDQKLSSDLLLTFMTVHLFQLGALLLATLEKFLDLFGFVWFGRNLSYTSVSCAPRSSEFRHYCVSDRTHCSADVWVVVLHVSISTSSWEWGPVASTPPTSLGSDCSYM